MLEIAFRVLTLVCRQIRAKQRICRPVSVQIMAEKENRIASLAVLQTEV